MKPSCVFLTCVCVVCSYIIMYACIYVYMQVQAHLYSRAFGIFFDCSPFLFNCSKFSVLPACSRIPLLLFISTRITGGSTFTWALEICNQYSGLQASAPTLSHLLSLPSCCSLMFPFIRDATFCHHCGSQDANSEVIHDEISWKNSFRQCTEELAKKIKNVAQLYGV